MQKKVSIFEEMYSLMLNHLGSQNWWPGETPFEVMVGAILTQNTNWSNVEKAISQLKEHQLLDPQKLYQLSAEELAPLIRSAGYFNVKSIRLKNFIKFFVERYSASIQAMQKVDGFTMREQLLSIRGIGPETADSILLYALEHPIFVIDAYTYRIWRRHFLIEEAANYEDMQELAHSVLSQDLKKFNEFHALLVNVGKNYCRPKKPKCELCPLQGLNWQEGQRHPHE